MDNVSRQDSKWNGVSSTRLLQGDLVEWSRPEVFVPSGERLSTVIGDNLCVIAFAFMLIDVITKLEKKWLGPSPPKYAKQSDWWRGTNLVSRASEYQNYRAFNDMPLTASSSLTWQIYRRR